MCLRHVMARAFFRAWSIRRLPCQSRARLLLAYGLLCPFCAPFVSLLCPLSRVNPPSPQYLRYKAQHPLDLGPVTPPPSPQSFFVCGPAALVGCSTAGFWYKLSIPGRCMHGLFANFHLGRPWCSINKPKLPKKTIRFWSVYRTPRPAEVKVREAPTGDR